MMLLRKVRASVIPIIALGLTGSTVTVVLPVILVGAVRNSRAAGEIVSTEMLGATLATAFLSPLLARANKRAIAIIATLIALGADILATHPHSMHALFAIRLGAGLAEGTVLALAVVYVAVTNTPERNVAFFVACNLLTATAILHLLPSIVSALGRYGAFWALALLAATSFAATFVLPRESNRRQRLAHQMLEASIESQSGVSVVAVAAGLLGTVVLFTGAGSVWPSMPALAALIGVPLTAVARMLGNATLAGIAGALAAAWLGTGARRRVMLLGGTLAMLASLVGLGSLHEVAAFAISAMLFMSSWIFLVPSYVGTLAAADPPGRAAAFSMATQYGGMALGASVAAMIGRRPLPLLITGAILVIGGMLLMLLADLSVARRHHGVMKFEANGTN